MAENVNNGTPLDLPNPGSSDDQYQIKEEDPSQSNSKEEEKNESVEEQNEEGTTDNSTGKRKASSSSSSIIWDTELRARFLHVVELLGVDNCTPKKIHQLLNVPGLSKERIASHLKTHRKTLKRMQEERLKLSISIKSESEDEDPTAVAGSSCSGKKPVDFPVPDDAGVGKKRSGPILSIENPQMSSKALKIGSPSSARPCSFEQLETNYKGESSGDMARQPTNFTSYEQLTASQRDQLREALSRTIPYRKPPVVPKLEPYSTDFSCMGSNLRSSTSNLGQYYPRDVNGLLQQYSSNEALLGSTSRSTWINRSSSSSSSTGFHVPIFESSLGSTSTTVGRSLLHGSSEASSMGMTSSWLEMNLTSPGGSFLSSTYAPENSNYYSRNITMRAPANINIGNNTSTTQTFSGYGNGREATVPYMNTSSMEAPLSTGLTNTTQNFFTTYGGNNYREVTRNYMNSTNPAVSSGFSTAGPAQSLLAAYGAIGADQVSPNYLNNTQIAGGSSVPQTYTAYGGNREVNPYMSTMEALGIANSTTQTFSGYNNGANREVRPNYTNTQLNTGVGVGFTSPTQNIPGAYADDNQVTPFGSEAGLSEYLDLISSSNPATDWTLPSHQYSGYPLYDVPLSVQFSGNYFGNTQGLQMHATDPDQGQEQEDDSANSFADNCLNDSGSVTGDSPVRTPEITTSHQQEAPESPGRRSEAELFEMMYKHGWDYGLGLNPNDHFPLNGQNPIQDTRAPAVSTTTGGTRNVDLFEMIFTRAREARNAEPIEGTNGFLYSSGSSENSGASPTQQLPDTDPSGTAGPTEESLTSGD